MSVKPQPYAAARFILRHWRLAIGGAAALLLLGLVMAPFGSAAWVPVGLAVLASVSVAVAALIVLNAGDEG